MSNIPLNIGVGTRWGSIEQKWQACFRLGWLGRPAVKIGASREQSQYQQHPLKPEPPILITTTTLSKDESLVFDTPVCRYRPFRGAFGSR